MCDYPVSLKVCLLFRPHGVKRCAVGGIELPKELKKEDIFTSMKATTFWGEGNEEMEGLSYREEEEEEIEAMDLIPGMAAMAIGRNIPLQITPEALLVMSDPVKSLVEQGRIFAVQHHQGRRRRKRCARISLTRDNKLYLHHLREEPLPSNAFVLEHSDVLRLVDTSSRMAFLKLGVVGSTLGRIHIRLAPNTHAAEQFSFLCTGEMGPSYANTRILEVREKGHEKEYVACGDYEMNNGSGGQAMIAGLGDTEQYNGQWLAGTVWGFLLWNAVAAQFCILTKDNPGIALCSPSFGMVEEGLHVLTEAIRHYHNIRDVFIVDCGMVLLCSLSR